MIDCTEFFNLVNDIETRELNNSVGWNPILVDARQAERVKAYEKMFNRFLDGKFYS